MQVGLLHLLVRLVGQVGEFGIGDGDELGLVLDRGAHLPEAGIGPGVEGQGCVIETDQARGFVEAVGVGHGQGAQQEGVNEAEGGRACAHGQGER